MLGVDPGDELFSGLCCYEGHDVPHTIKEAERAHRPVTRSTTET